MEYHKDNKYDGTVLTAYVDDPTGYVGIVRDDKGQIMKIVEHKDAPEEIKIKEINSGYIVCKGKLLKDALSKIDNDNAQGEYYVTDVIKRLKEEGHRVGLSNR